MTYKQERVAALIRLVKQRERYQSKYRAAERTGRRLQLELEQWKRAAQALSHFVRNDDYLLIEFREKELAQELADAMNLVFGGDHIVVLSDLSNNGPVWRIKPEHA